MSLFKVKAYFDLVDFLQPDEVRPFVTYQPGQSHGAFRVIRREYLVDDLGSRGRKVGRWHGQRQENVAADIEILGYDLEWTGAESAVIVGPGGRAERRHQYGREQAGFQSIPEIHFTLQQREFAEWSPWSRAGGVSIMASA